MVIFYGDFPPHGYSVEFFFVSRRGLRMLLLPLFVNLCTVTEGRSPPLIRYYLCKVHIESSLAERNRHLLYALACYFRFLIGEITKKSASITLVSTSGLSRI
jgi:hypothetical protein